MRLDNHNVLADNGVRLGKRTKKQVAGLSRRNHYLFEHIWLNEFPVTDRTTHRYMTASCTKFDMTSSRINTIDMY